MECLRKVTDDLYWVGGNDRRLAMFEGVYSVPRGVSYNAYLLLDDVTVLLDTVDRAVGDVFFENIARALNGRALNYVVVQHMEPDHSATLMDLLRRYPDATVVCSQMTLGMIRQFFDLPDDPRAYVVAEGGVLCAGRHTLRFYMAPMVHWPEVMVTFDETAGTLFSADAFGTFGALDGALFADEVDFMRDYLDEARRYYCNIVGKYGQQVQALLRKAGGLAIKTICPLHGFVWRANIGDYIEKYQQWSAYQPEEAGVMIAYASVYGHTANVADGIACKLRELGVRTAVYDVSVTPCSEIVAAAFRWSHLLFASTTYNAGVFISMDELLRDLAAHNLQNRTVAFVENGSWAATAGKLMRQILAPCKHMTYLDETLSLRSAFKREQTPALDALVRALADSLPKPEASAPAAAAALDPAAFFKLSYGLFVLTVKDGEKDNGCIINTAQLLTDTPKRITIAVNKLNYTHELLMKTGVFNVSVLTERAPFDVFRHFGFRSGRDGDKFDGGEALARSANGLYYLTECANAMISGRVIAAADNGTHTLFTAEVTEAAVLSAEPSVTYDYYFKHIKPKPQPTDAPKKGFVCKICGYVYEGETLPPDFICPLCKHGAEDFEPIR